MAEIERWAVSTEVDDLGRPLGGDPVPFGPIPFTLPSRWTARCVDVEDGLIAEVNLTFGGDRAEVERLTVFTAPDRPSLSARDVGRVKLAAIVGHAVQIAVRPIDPMAVIESLVGGGDDSLTEDHYEPMTDAEWQEVRDDADLDRALVALYWLHHVSWKAPRQAVMELFGVSRTTANRLITTAGERYPLPARVGAQS